jgi:DNA-binding response OmpR family regulator
MRFLVIENDAARHRLLRSLANSGCRIDTVFNMDEAFELFGRINYSVVIVGAGFSESCAIALVTAVRRKVSRRSTSARLGEPCATVCFTAGADDDHDVVRDKNRLLARWAELVKVGTNP